LENSRHSSGLIACRPLPRPYPIHSLTSHSQRTLSASSASRMRSTTLALLLLSALLISAQKSHAKGTPELVQPIVYESDNSELLAKVSSQLLNALANIESMQEGTPIKIAEKRRNKFEFIRFGRK
ncbi:hypothetical protein COOONC_00593, partial [Cooperia oncophora]